MATDESNTITSVNVLDEYEEIEVAMAELEMAQDCE